MSIEHPTVSVNINVYAPLHSPTILFWFDPVLHKNETGEKELEVLVTTINPSHADSEEFWFTNNETDKSQYWQEPSSVFARES